MTPLSVLLTGPRLALLLVALGLLGGWMLPPMSDADNLPTPTPTVAEHRLSSSPGLVATQKVWSAKGAAGRSGRHLSRWVAPRARPR